MTRPKKKPELTAFEEAEISLYNFSPFGATANRKETIKILAKLDNDELILLFNTFGDRYAATVDNGCIGSSLIPYSLIDENEAYFDSDEDTGAAIEDMTDCLRARAAIADVHGYRMELAKKKAVKSARLKLV